MNQREQDLKTIAQELAVWEVNIKNLNAVNLQDINIISEQVICELLNLVFGYELKNVNADQNN
ncbi:SMEK domain-containing protein [Flavobacterium sp. Sd200]|nr:SMEK domain-containing protein [Flavobacterium sp. Sd200]